MEREGRGPLGDLPVRHVPHPFAIRRLLSEGSSVAPTTGDYPLLETYLGYLRRRRRRPPARGLGAPPRVMRTFLEAVDAHHGGVAGLLADHGVGTDAVRRLSVLLIDEEKP